MKGDLRLIADAYLYSLYVGLGFSLIGFMTILALEIEDVPHNPLEGIWSLQPYAVLEFGILILILSPFFAMLMTLLYFIKQKDIKHAFLTAIIISVLIMAIFLNAQ